ncbi:MAG TPA: gamma-glutamylcyclotransferase family protein [Beijerinckia sp.]|nr:gamma-glutamylcyclotransferase family protein [Beijerinckia sp.]
MPLYFAYGSNMDLAAMQQRCPQARALGPARLARHMIFIMTEGYASVRRDMNTQVHGVLYDIGFGDLKALDRYEEIGRGLYVKMTQPVLRNGAGPVHALIYIGSTTAKGQPKPGYLEGVTAAARQWGLPQAYISHLESLGGSAAGAVQNPGRWRAIKLKPAP